MIKVSKGCLGEEELAEVKEAFDYGYFGLAQKVVEFEQALGRFLGAERVVATNTGTSALHLALDGIGVGAGDEVIVPSLTFVASFQAISATGATPVACDVHPNSLLLDIKDARSRITERTKAIMPVHYAGNPCDMDALMQIREEYGIRIVEDAAHALGSCYRGKKIGSFGDITCFSFDSIKNITCGEGGAIVYHGAYVDTFERKRLLGIDRKSHASSSWKERGWSFEVRTQGFRYHMSNINAAIGLAQLRKVESFIERRRDICRKYDRSFCELPGLARLDIDYDVVAPHVYVVRVKDDLRDGLMQYLKDLDIETGVNYIPNHLHPFYAREGLVLPETELAFKEILTLPLHCGLSDEDVDTVVAAVIDGIAGGKARRLKVA